ncbi:hypothetical protein PCL_09705 [Purpureocillium lilacinum]|uniref:Uncharacterized protein n=1 Tax=Purpureocillium lilacinum TaxID=33203 RepID=A0A2U3EE17_PURLI|nr:hypothetical protein Purlil1_3613 [Purpureocillium lilacinum]PWI72690.1 hypothetical protein PCL_09705 [Purpureocillium lilacinum]
MDQVTSVPGQYLLTKRHGEGEERPKAGRRPVTCRTPPPPPLCPTAASLSLLSRPYRPWPPTHRPQPRDPLTFETNKRTDKRTDKRAIVRPLPPPLQHRTCPGATAIHRDEAPVVSPAAIPACICFQFATSPPVTPT